MRQFKNNLKRNRSRNNFDRSFKRVPDTDRLNGNFANNDNSFRRKIKRSNGNVQKLISKYNDLAREALSNGDKILSENYFQHADHFLRISNDKDRNSTKNINDEQRPNNNIETSENKEALDQNQDSKNII